MTRSSRHEDEVRRGAMLLQALLSEALRVGHSGSRTFVSTVVATEVLRDAFAYIDDHAETVGDAPGEPRQVTENVIALSCSNLRAR